MTTIRHAGRRRRRQTQPPLPTATPTFPGSRIAKRWSVPKASARGINDAASGSTISLHRLSPENRHQPCDPTSPMGPWRPATIRWLPCLCAPVAGSHAIPAGHAIVDVGLIGLAPGRLGPLARVRRPFDGRHPTHKIRDPHDPSTPPVHSARPPRPLRRKPAWQRRRDQTGTQFFREIPEPTRCSCRRPDLGSRQ